MNGIGGLAGAAKIMIPSEYNGKPVIGIGKNAFAFCDSITDVTLPDSVTSVGEGAFSGCASLSGINLSNSITSVGDYVFDCCGSLLEVTFLGTAEEWQAFIGLTKDWGVEWDRCVIYDRNGNSLKKEPFAY